MYFSAISSSDTWQSSGLRDLGLRAQLKLAIDKAHTLEIPRKPSDVAHIEKALAKASVPANFSQASQPSAVCPSFSV